MFRSTTIISERVLSLAKIILEYLCSYRLCGVIDIPSVIFRFPSRSVISRTQHFLIYVLGQALLNKDKKCVLRTAINSSLCTIRDTTNCGMFEIEFLLSESEIRQSAVRSLLKRLKAFILSSSSLLNGL
jgi:hypothetical protein